MPVTVTVGTAIMVITAEPVAVFEHTVVLASFTETSL